MKPLLLTLFLFSASAVTAQRSGFGAGLIIGYLAKQHKKEWALMSPREKGISIALVIVCSLVAIAGFAWYAFR